MVDHAGHRPSESGPLRGVCYPHGAGAPACLTIRKAYFGDHGLLDTPVLDRPGLVGAAHAGPLIVEE